MNILLCVCVSVDRICSVLTSCTYLESFPRRKHVSRAKIGHHVNSDLSSYQIWLVIMTADVERLPVATKMFFIHSKIDTMVSLKCEPQVSICRRRNQLTPWSRVLHEKLIVVQLVRKFPDFLTIRFITVFTRAENWTLSCPEPDESRPHPQIFLRTFCKHFSSLPCVLHAPPILLTFPVFWIKIFCTEPPIYAIPLE
jgi:hypothetical protein